ncbi:2-amino-4-hydroxy-6-hydroxymethyldihydropteridine diphosphokinase [Tepidibacter formicigenes]|jgi:2-amino-4-hydroxy-6-hydroxymethyldihydropteridine diphosphokinase|uniref:2-amino-4-hydroxy-6-hydroxymethyldihydropteridine diphosphokinase n=1 Tax=Tepidibacter formicigenes DSM 15518 TaxID=1123349 RepID=A0A1M6PGS6_9FIRM|nr:2-amino-4-hydroxy-6-hydroxymethyldihydropteridine diphosphokinase [Tepidibacter formicigenes]SHK07151.1 2-amino-4-hydroxy-6-hydroxymethyldihydropteridinediphosphokinase [Tepidibacter formicigenes DSM 15518]
MSNVYLSLGTNMGDREKYLKDAIDLINNFEDTKIVKISKVYETKPWGYTNQKNFLNLCLKINTNLSPHNLLKKCQEAERFLKRERIIRWGPRTIDVDILIYDDIICNDENLTLPHPRIQERAFVLVPLMDLDEDLIIKGKKIKDWLELVDVEDVKEYIGDE